MGARLRVFKVKGGYEHSFLNRMLNWEDWLKKTLSLIANTQLLLLLLF